MTTDFLADFGDLGLLDDPENAQCRGERLSTAFQQSKIDFTSEKAFTESSWYDPPEIPPPSPLLVRNIDYLIQKLYLQGKFSDTLQLVLSQIEMEQENDGKNGRTKELFDIAMRCAIRLNDAKVVESLASKTVPWWHSAPGLAELSANAYLIARRPRDALSGALCAIHLRGTLPPYISLVAQALEMLQQDASNTQSFDSMLSVVKPHTSPFRPLFPELLWADRPRGQSRTEAGIILDPVDVFAAKSFAESCGISVLDQDRLVRLLCRQRNASEDVEHSDKTVRSL
ncbi:hypothetical protein BD410DRAFT_606454 [Rickenella mellea]|uniref:Uncharacterized protein n=1 Tax=Rickenella mellea TaxID=50990 RepID=A0A4Y7QF75_9AGAM|nr:hypothetical protein BD410DRAFT_606454 [Rickenella mellea]